MKIYEKACFFNSFIYLLFFPESPKSHHLEFTLNGIQFEKLRIGTLDNSTGQEVLLWGTTNDKCKWTFEIPDSLWTTIN